MEKLVKCSKVLYDITICDKMKEITMLKNKYETPKKIYESHEEWDKTLERALLLIKNGIQIAVISDKFERGNMFTNGIREKSQENIREHLNSAFVILTDNKVWSELKANEIVNGVRATFEAIITTASLFPPINVVPPPNDLELSDKISQVLQSIIFNRLFNYYEGGGILEDIILLEKV